MQIVEKIVSKIERLSKLFFYIGAVSLCILLLLIFFDVTGRFLINEHITGTEIYSQYLMVCVGFFALGFGQFRGSHPRMQFFGEMIYKKQRPYIYVFTTVIATAFFILFSTQIVKQAYADWSEQILQPMTIISLPVWYLGLLAGIGSIMLILVLLTQLTRGIINIFIPPVDQPVLDTKRQGE